jgi:hypothetical protein
VPVSFGFWGASFLFVYIILLTQCPWWDRGEALRPIRVIGPNGRNGFFDSTPPQAKCNPCIFYRLPFHHTRHPPLQCHLAF